MQALALGHIGSLAEGREVVGNSFAMQHYEPGQAAPWEDAYGRYLGLLG
jgi:rhamnulokinase